MRTLRELRFGDDLGTVDGDDAKTIGVGDVDVVAVGLDDVALVDAHLLGVGAREVLARHRAGRDADVRSGLGRFRGRRHVALGHHASVAVVEAAASQSPRSDPLARLGLHVAQQRRTVTEELEVRRGEALRTRTLPRLGRARRRAGRLGRGHVAGCRRNRRVTRRRGLCRLVGRARRSDQECSGRECQWDEPFTHHVCWTSQSHAGFRQCSLCSDRANCHV